jgi:hypothetical protein
MRYRAGLNTAYPCLNSRDLFEELSQFAELEHQNVGFNDLSVGG